MFKVGDKVLVDDYKGTIKEIHNVGLFDVYIVELNIGRTMKTFKENLTKLQEKEDKPDTITISREDFKKAVLRATNPNHWLGKMKDPTTVNMLTLSGLAVSSELEDILFGEVQ